MSFMGRAFGARHRPPNEPPQLDKVLADLHVGAEENDDPSTTNWAVAAEAITAKLAEMEAPNHRERLEKLLNDASRIAQLLEKEAADAALAENLKLDEKRAAVAKLAQAQGEAEAEARSLEQQAESAAMRRAQIEAEVRTAQEAVEAAEDSVKRLEGLLAESRTVVIQTKSKLAESEGRSRDATQQAETNAAKVHDVNARITKCRDAREAAESELREAETIASGITQTAATLKQLREAGSHGLTEVR